ncbi:MAG: Glutamate--tRNA ligase 1 [Candidatus Dependentiae bacterium ADurb.Bin331]|nr:MAG: Glutamate--tRNA ligase 1 [Candidatus Dependentiae bacterium ADurb.Bin331]
MISSSVRVRFAPSPTGLMHLGSARLALFNYLFAKHYNGTFILRIEDTDLERNFDPGGAIIIEDLGWLNLNYQEGPGVGGPDAPYLQSQRGAIYQEKLTELINKNLVYRCFCSVEELEHKRTRQIALKQPPRYDRTCLKRSPVEIEQLMIDNKPFVWRCKVPHETIQIHDLARGFVSFDLANFSDFPLTREDGSFTFLFVNCVDDILMRISHVIRGEDHLSNTANQVVLYKALSFSVPTFWHMPIICNSEGKKLSKRDFGFSLRDLRNGGYLPEAICNYLAIIGASFEQEIMQLDELAQVINFEKMHTTSTIKYDLEKLRWVNHQWIVRLPIAELTKQTLPFLHAIYPESAQIEIATIEKLVASVKDEIHTLKDIEQVLQFYFVAPISTREKLLEHVPENYLNDCLRIIHEQIKLLNSPHEFMVQLKYAAQQHGIPPKIVFMTVRLLLSGTAHGHGINDMIELIGTEKATQRINAVK